MNQEEFKKALEELDIDLTKEQEAKLKKFYELLISWNEKINLTRITEEKDVYLKHFYDSLTICKVVDLKKVKTLCDVGTGAGFPGIVLKIVFPNLKVTLLDSLNKRVLYLKEIIKELNLQQIDAIHCRGEEYRGKFDVVTSRAVANILKLVDYTMHLVDKNGVFVAMKGDISKELSNDIRKKIEKKYQIKKISKFNLPVENSNRSLIVLINK